jgi:hypothetical protein
MKKIPAVVLALFLVLGWTVATAGPAPWYKWRSKLDGTIACSQTPLGAGWDRAAGPYQDSHCEKPAIAK